MANYGLGRWPSPPDPRDFQLRAFLADNPLPAAFQVLNASKGVAAATKTWAKAVTDYLVPPAPAPAPTGDTFWADNEPVLDQGQTPHCVGFGGAQWGNTLPVDDHWRNADGDALYYECKVLDGEPKAENGSSVRSLAKALKNRGRMSAYAFASTTDEVAAWVHGHGPVILGTNWYDGMFTPDQNGYVSPTGNLAGGHCFACIGWMDSEDAAVCLNSWGDGWGQHGRFKIKRADLARLLSEQGEACAAVEVP